MAGIPQIGNIQFNKYLLMKVACFLIITQLKQTITLKLKVNKKWCTPNSPGDLHEVILKFYFWTFMKYIKKGKCQSLWLLSNQI